MLKRRLFLLVVAVLLAFSTAGMVSAAPAESVVSSGIIKYDEMVETLQILEERGDGKLDVFTLREIGIEEQSQAGRDLYIAKIGNGDKDVWVQGRIHGNEPYGTNATLRLIENLIEEKDASYKKMMEELTIHFIPMYNPDGAERDERGTRVYDPETGEFGPQQDLNRDWHEDRFNLSETVAFWRYYTQIKPDFTLDIHHQGNKTFYGTDIPVTMSLGIALAPGGPTLPYIKDGEYEVVTKQAAVHMYDALKEYPQFTVNQYRVGRDGTAEIDHRGGISSGAMRSGSINHLGLNPDGHSNPGVFLETSGRLLDGESEPLIQQNIVAAHALLHGLATGELYDNDPDRWDEIPHPPLESYSTDWAGTFPAENPKPAVFLDTSADDVKELVRYYEEAGKFENDRVARSLDVHLAAVSHYEGKEETDKFLKHMQGFERLLDHQKESMTDVTYSTLKAYADYLMED